MVKRSRSASVGDTFKEEWQAYYYSNRKDATRVSASGKWVRVHITSSVPGSGNYARAGITTKVDVPMGNDRASGTWWTNGVKY